MLKNLLHTLSVTLFLCIGCSDYSILSNGSKELCSIGFEETDPTTACNDCGCTACFCGLEGWVCKGALCDSCDLSNMLACSLTCENGFELDSKGCTMCSCKNVDGPCEPGDTKNAADGCNSCVCDSDGIWTCTDDTCAAECDPGESMPASDNCNICTCSPEGQWQCTSETCSGCTPGHILPPPDECCTCTNGGEWECSQTPCPQGCTDGATKEKGDGCNICTCSSNHEWICTEQECSEGADCPEGLENTCEKKLFWGKNLFTGTCCEYDSPCSIPDGLEKFADVESCEKAPWQNFLGDAIASEPIDEGVPADANLP